MILFQGQAASWCLASIPLELSQQRTRLVKTEARAARVEL
jgi:hypothetical protein